jgi:hypothetical protein
VESHGFHPQHWGKKNPCRINAGLTFVRVGSLEVFGRLGNRVKIKEIWGLRRR